MPWVYKDLSLKNKKKVFGERKKPEARIGHVAVCLDEHRLLIIGGGNNGEHFTGTVWMYDIDMGVWTARETTGTVPRTTTDSTAWVHHGSVYIFGGYHGLRHSNDIYMLNVWSFEWEKCAQMGSPPTPRHGAISWLIDDRVVIFGGFGGPPTDMQDYDEYLKYNDSHSSGWNNQLYILDHNSNGSMEWSKPRTTGQPPSPRTLAAHALIRRTAYLFGGWCGSLRFNDMFMLDLDALVWEEMKTNLRAPPKLIPKPRYGSSMTVLNDDKMFLCGGRDDYMKHLSECWLFQLKSSKRLEVTKIRVKELKGLYAHSASLLPGCEDKIYVFGGEDASKKATDMIGCICLEEVEVDEVEEVEEVEEKEDEYEEEIKSEGDIEEEQADPFNFLMIPSASTVDLAD